MMFGRAKILTVRPPWAYLFFIGDNRLRKDVENRTWSTAYRGPVLIHVSKTRRPSEESRDLAEVVQHIVPELRYGTYLTKALPALSRAAAGKIIGVVDLVDCVRRSRSRWAADCQYHWRVENPRLLAERIPYRGQLGLPDAPPEVLSQIRFMTVTRACADQEAGHAGKPRPQQSECAWCGVVLRKGVEPVTHDICVRCADQQREKWRQPGAGSVACGEVTR